MQGKGEELLRSLKERLGGGRTADYERGGERAILGTLRTSREVGKEHVVDGHP